MAEELTESLSRIRELRVIGRTSSEIAKASGADLASMGEKLNVGAIVEGSVRRSGDQIRVTAQFIRVADESHLWSGRYDRTLDDVFAIQREIAQDVAEAIRTELGVGETRSWLVAKRYAPRDVRAWELIKRAVDQRTFTKEGFRRELELASAALEIDPSYAQAHAQRAWAYLFLLHFSFEPRVAETKAKARAAAERALELDPTNGAALHFLAISSEWEFDWEGCRGHQPTRSGSQP